MLNFCETIYNVDFPLPRHQLTADMIDSKEKSNYAIMWEEELQSTQFVNSTQLSSRADHKRSLL